MGIHAFIYCFELRVIVAHDEIKFSFIRPALPVPISQEVDQGYQLSGVGRVQVTRKQIEGEVSLVVVL